MGPSDIAMLCILFILVLLSAFFSSAETALTSVNKMSIRMMLNEGVKKAKTLQKVRDDSGKMLSAILIGNNIVNISASSLMTVFVQKMFGNAAVSIGTGILTLIVLVFGEIIPKTAATLYAEKIALVYAAPIYFLMVVLTPIIFIVDKISFVFMRLFGIKKKGDGEIITEKEIRAIMGVSQEEGLIEEEELDMINNVFDFGDTCAKDIMIPKIDIAMISIDSTYDELMNIVKNDKYTRIPVYKDDTDNIVGIINIKDMIIHGVGRNNFDVEKLMYEPFYTIATKDLNDLLVEMRDENHGMCIVLDEYGAVDGLITLEDIIEEIVGEIRDEFDEDEEKAIIKLNDNEYLIEGQLNLVDFNDQFETDIDSDNYESVGGLILEQLDRVPEIGDSVVVDNCKLEVMRMDNMRIDKVKVTMLESVNGDITSEE
ncbi:MAG: HlyC/CorC family transporter [Lachnospiraceae bacterium]|nr:HlyC/CorC family transporter [Lachnospiraceae bacterium]